MFKLHLNSSIFYKWLLNCSKMRNNKPFRNNDTVTNDRQSNNTMIQPEAQAAGSMNMKQGRRLQCMAR